MYKDLEKKKETLKKYYLKNKEKLRKRNREQYYKHIEKRKKEQKEYRDKKRDSINEKHREYRENNKEKIREWHIEYSKNNKEKRKAKATVLAHIRNGRMVRPLVCSKCGVKCKPDGHHEDYSKPTEVIWLCKSCHKFLHSCNIG